MTVETTETFPITPRGKLRSCFNKPFRSCLIVLFLRCIKLMKETLNFKGSPKQRIHFNFPELPTFEAHQEQDKSKAELGLTEEQVETLKQASSLVGMFQQEALNEKQTRLLAQLKALEKVCALFFCSL